MKKISFENDSKVELGNKTKNLQKLERFQNESIYKVPFFIPLCIGENTKTVKEEFEKRNISLVSVRSSSNTEDTNDDSKAGAFKTFINVNISDIDIYINEIQKHALEKFGYKIPIIIQEMVGGISGVAFSSDPDTGKNYTVLNYHNGVGEDLVSGNISGNIVKIYNGGNNTFITNALHKKIFDTINYLKSQLDYKDLDIEFVYSGDILYLLQVRPITKINGGKKEVRKLVDRYVNFVTLLLKKRKYILGDMIDVNPEELVGKQPFLIKTFFGHIFPETSLKDARKYLGYHDGDNFFSFVLDKTYVNLEKNIKSFLPSSLTDEEINIFVKYYSNNINLHPELQNQLDSILYPNNLDKVIEILNGLDLDENLKKSVLKKFEVFFGELNIKIDLFSSQYDIIEKKLLSKAGVHSFYDLLSLEHFDGNIYELLGLIKETTYYFSLYARFFFFLSNNGEIENHDYFKKNIYQSHIAQGLINSGNDSIEFYLPEGFNFLSLIKQIFELRDYIVLENVRGPVGNIDISKVARENLKFLFMNLFRLLKNKLYSLLDLSKNDFSGIELIDFKALIGFIDGESSLKSLQFLIKKGQVKKEISKLLEFPSVINKSNSLIDNTLFGNNGFYSGEGTLEGEICIIESVNDFETKDFKGKIIIIENATPEIDIYLKDIKGIITKNGGPLAHIMIRARELGIPAVVGTIKYDKIVKDIPKSLKICFNSKEIIF